MVQLSGSRASSYVSGRAPRFPGAKRHHVGPNGPSCHASDTERLQERLIAKRRKAGNECLCGQASGLDPAMSTPPNLVQMLRRRAQEQDWVGLGITIHDHHQVVAPKPKVSTRPMAAGNHLLKTLKECSTRPPRRRQRLVALFSPRALQALYPGASPLLENCLLLISLTFPT
ncbi:hypothetical protein BKA80DRAFT_55945 [Phyllosticta citrichinensis]